MVRALGLARDPFAPACDGDLFWEDRSRADLRRAVAERLGEGRGVWVSGPPGAGRAALLDRVAEDLAAAGSPVLKVDAPVAGSPEEFLLAVLAAAGGADPGRGHLEAAGALYDLLLRAFAAAGPVACFPGALSARPAVVAEVEILAGLRVAGSGLVGVALAGGGESPLPGLETVRLPPPGPEGVRALLLHRLAACGGAGLLAPEVLDRLASAAGGIGEAVALARRELWRMAFERSVSAALSAPPASPPPAMAPGLFDAAQLKELSGLLASLGPEE